MIGMPFKNIWRINTKTPHAGGVASIDVFVVTEYHEGSDAAIKQIRNHPENDCIQILDVTRLGHGAFIPPETES